ncbi:serine/threonine protein kinase [Phytophthora nicotianae INRA-310]|uniref:Serine/threonine protein kinase n=2 Tax=Phytophthora nicotianae TaxID=4792 RepID=W2QPN4_PHYN3|nr:serine/threonine protein kinase [Phytophthora nicotianae INRA-310]ETN14464.1 serine/threonine protein kinase [Phytophthora nicotianae INRA-310]KUF83478.1 ABC transporter G family member 36 [Phytophthora nicotianae]KUF93506.1 Tyrosine-protein kinase HCK [Phytophthora nicotianae]KUG00134.1 Tyrosine-protein kinase HCK [Phytophthora nicotianae]
MFHIAALVSSFLAPQDSTSALSKDDTDVLWILCQDTGNEFHELFTSVYERLRLIHQILHGCGRDNLFSSVAVLVLHRRLVARFQVAVSKHRRLNVLVRFATKRSTLEKLQEIHRDIDQLFGFLKLQKHTEMTNWRREWTQQCNRMYALFRVRVDDPRPIVVRLANPQIAEILGIIKFELEYHTEELPQQQAELMRKTITKILRCSNVHVPKISRFFIPPVDMELGDTHTEIKDTSCEVKRSVYDQGTRLIAQYLSADNRYARQLFWNATEIWHGFEHPNVAKILGESMLLSQPCVVWEDAAAHGNFIHYFASERENNQRNLWRMFLQVAHGLNHIHQRGKTHGSLKCSHILVAEDGIPKICHFELSRGADVGGVDRWKGPEYNLGNGVDPSKAGDVYAFGLCIIEARIGDIPYGVDCDDSVKSQLEELECYPRPEGFRDDEWNVVKRFVAHDPMERPTVAQAIEMIEELAWQEAMDKK